MRGQKDTRTRGRVDESQLREIEMLRKMCPGDNFIIR